MNVQMKEPELSRTKNPVQHYQVYKYEMAIFSLKNTLNSEEW